MKPRSLALALAAALVSTLATWSPADAVVSWKVADPVGDVKLYADSGGYTKAQRRSIDVERVRAVTVEGGATRFTVSLRAVLPGMPGDQMVFLSTRPLPGRGAYPRLDAGWSPQKPSLGYATLYTSADDFVNCDPLPTPTFSTANDVVGQVVPHECLPPGRQRVLVSTAVGTFRSEGSFSLDTVRFRRAVR